MLFFKKNNTWPNSSHDVDTLINKIEYFYKEKHYQGIKQLISNTSIELLVVALEKIDVAELSLFFLSASDSENLCKFFLSFSIDNKVKIIDLMSNFLLKKLIEDLNADDFVEILEYLDSDQYKKVIICAPSDLRVEVKKIKRFSNGKVGSAMNTTVISLKEKSSIQNAIDFLKHKKNELDIEQEIYVLSDDEKVMGVVKIQDLFFYVEPSVSITEVMEKNPITLEAAEDIDDAITIFQKYEINNIAVVDSEDKFLGIINNKDMIPEIIEESLEDIYKLHGITITQNSYARSSIYEIVQSRITWLIFLLFTTTFTTLILVWLEKVGHAWTSGISSAALVPLGTMIAGMSGNCSGQSTASIIQSFTTKEISLKDFKKILLKEFRVAVVIGLILCAFNFMRLIIFYAVFPVTVPSVSSLKERYIISAFSSLISSFSLLLVVVFSKITSVLVTYKVIKLGYDAASATTPVLTTILDVVSTFVFFGLGILIMSGVKNAGLITQPSAYIYPQSLSATTSVQALSELVSISPLSEVAYVSL